MHLFISSLYEGGTTDNTTPCVSLLESPALSRLQRRDTLFSRAQVPFC